MWSRSSTSSAISCTRCSAAITMGGDRRHQHRAGLRRGAVADARGVDLGSGDAGDVREALPDERADSGGAREADAPRQRVRQGARRAAADGLRAAVALDLRPRPDSRSTPPRWSRTLQTRYYAVSRTSRARTSRPRSATSTATRRSTTPTCGRWSSRRTCSASSIARTCWRPRVAHKYRDTILAPGGSKPAAALVHDFLGRPFDFKAWEQWLNRDEQ